MIANRKALVLPLLAFAGCAGAPDLSNPPAPAESATVDLAGPDSAFVAEAEAVSAAVVEHEREIAAMWPGFWSEGQAFAQANLAGTSAVYAVVQSDSIPGYVPLRDAPPVLAGRAHFRPEPLPGSDPGTLPAAPVALGPDEGYVQPLIVRPGLSRPIPNRVSFLVHESFHVWQNGGGFAPVPEDSITGLVPLAFLRDTLFVSDPEYRMAVERENVLLRAVAVENDPERLRSALTEYLVARDARLRDRPDLVRVERRYERDEGTATYVGCHAGGAVARPGWTPTCLTDDLIDATAETFPVPGGAVGYLTRWRLYSSGAVLADALERLGVQDWRGRIAAGEYVEAVVRDTVAS